ncbi:MAG: HAD family hydrolase [Candidatus Hydrogenedentota bacterium]
MSTQLIISDIDGCLSPEASIAWDMTAFDAFLARVRPAQTGNSPLAPFTLCTGRPQPYVEVLAKLLDIRAPIICENGAVIYSLHDNWSRYGPGVTEEKIAGLRAIRGFLDGAVLRAHPGALYQYGKEAMLSVFSADPAILPPIADEITAFVAREGLAPPVINTSVHYLNISMAGVNKGTALHWLLDELGMAGAQAAGIGDTIGDIPLREAVGWFACPANADPALKERADYVSAENDIRGLVDILDQPACKGGSNRLRP